MDGVDGWMEGKVLIAANLAFLFLLTPTLTSTAKQKKLPGCVVFTSSVSGYMPSPFSCTFALTHHSVVR